MIGWLLTAALLYLFLLMKTGVYLRWDSGSAVLKLRIGIFRFALPANKKAAQTSDKKPADKDALPKENKPAKPMLKKWIRALLVHWRETLELIVRVLRAPKLDLLRLHIAVGDKEPDVCAINYGRFCAALSAALPVVDQMFSVKKQDVEITCQFDRETTDILAEVEAIVRVYEVFALLVGGLLLLIKLYRHTKLNEKAVQIL